MIIYGTRTYGRVDEIEDVGAVETKFFHVFWVPLIPMRSMFVFDDDEGLDDGEKHIASVPKHGHKDPLRREKAAPSRVDRGVCRPRVARSAVQRGEPFNSMSWLPLRRSRSSERSAVEPSHRKRVRTRARRRPSGDPPPDER